MPADKINDTPPVIGIWGIFKTSNPFHHTDLLQNIEQITFKIILEAFATEGARTINLSIDAAQTVKGVLKIALKETGTHRSFRDVIRQRFSSLTQSPSEVVASDPLQAVKTALVEEFKKANMTILPDNFIERFFHAFMQYAEQTSNYFFRGSAYGNIKKEVCIRLHRQPENPSALDDRIWFESQQVLAQNHKPDQDHLICTLEGNCSASTFEGHDLQYAAYASVSPEEAKAAKSDPRTMPSEPLPVLLEVAAKSELFNQGGDVTFNVRRQPVVHVMDEALKPWFTFDRGVAMDILYNANTTGTYEHYEKTRVALLQALEEGYDIDFQKIWDIRNHQDFKREVLTFVVKAIINGKLREEKISWPLWSDESKAIYEINLFIFLHNVTIICCDMGYSKPKIAEVIARILQTNQSWDYPQKYMITDQLYTNNPAFQFFLSEKEKFESHKVVVFDLQAAEQYTATIERTAHYRTARLLIDGDDDIFAVNINEPPIAKITLRSRIEQGVLITDSVDFSVSEACKALLVEHVNPNTLTSLVDEIVIEESTERISSEFDRTDSGYITPLDNSRNCQIILTQEDGTNIVYSATGKNLQELLENDFTFMAKQANVKSSLLQGEWFFENDERLSADLYEMPICFYFKNLKSEEIYFEHGITQDRKHFIKTKRDGVAQSADRYKTFEAFLEFLKRLKASCKLFGYTEAYTINLLAGIISGSRAIYFIGESIAPHLIKKVLPPEMQAKWEIDFTSESQRQVSVAFDLQFKGCAVIVNAKTVGVKVIDTDTDKAFLSTRTTVQNAAHFDHQSSVFVYDSVLIVQDDVMKVALAQTPVVSQAFAKQVRTQQVQKTQEAESLMRKLMKALMGVRDGTGLHAAGKLPDVLPVQTPPSVRENADDVLPLVGSTRSFAAARGKTAGGAEKVCIVSTVSSLAKAADKKIS